jgi:hypothetical protein
VREGHVNVDFRQTHPNVIIADLSRFPWPFADACASQVLMLDFLEHFPWAQTAQILLECYRVLEPSGVVVVQVPDALHTTRALTQRGHYRCNRCGAGFHDGEVTGTRPGCPGCGQTRDEVSEVAMRRFYGGQDYPGNWHQTCFTEQMLRSKAKAAGLEQIERGTHDAKAGDDEHYWANWTLHMTFRKGDLW